jgi:multidrug efflux pump subunit AcrB
MMQDCRIRAVVDEVNASASDLTIEIMSDESETIQEAIDSVAQTLILGVILSMIILFVFMGNIRASLIVGSSMPVSLLMAFICMNAMGFTLNVITMGAMVLGVGMMVDNSIVVIDSCFKNAGRRTFAEAAVEGTKFVMLSIVASTITTVVVFLPLASVGGMVGQMFQPLGYTVAFALLASLFSAITLVPLFFAQFKPVEKKNTPVARFLKLCERGYSRLLRVILNKKKTVFAFTLALVALALYFATNLNMELMSSTDEGSINISVSTRSGSSLEKTDAIVREIEGMVAEHADVERYNTRASAGSGSVSVTLKSDRAMSTADVVEQWRLATADMTDCDITVSSSSSMTSGMSSDQVSVNLSGNDLDSLREASEEIADLFRARPDMITVTTSLESGDPQIDIQVDIDKATAYGMTPAEVATGVNRALGGVNAATLTRDGKDYSVQVEYPPDKYVTLSDLENMILSSNTGTSVSLTDVASLQFTNAAQSIRKEDGQYNVSVSGTPVAGQYFTAQSEIQSQVNALRLPDGVTLSSSSMNRMMDSAFSSIYQAIAIAVLLVFMVMTIQFESIKHSLMVMVCIPFSLIGSMGLLVLTGTTLNMTSLLGFLVLVGTVVNNGILFVDTTNEYRKNLDVKKALIRTGRHRLRPILMTTLTTVLSMVPMAIGLGTGSEMMQGMGIVVIGGLTASTILTLLLLPTFYLIIDGNPEKRRQKKEARQAKRDAKVQAIRHKNRPSLDNGAAEQED